MELNIKENNTLNQLIFCGEESFNEIKERDEIKKDLCEKNNVHLIYYNYDEEISESVLRQKIEKVIKLND